MLSSLRLSSGSSQAFKALGNPGPDLVVCDEGHRIKKLDSDIYGALIRIRTVTRLGVNFAVL